MEIKKLKDLKPGDFFTRKPIEAPNGNQVYIRGTYDRTLKRYECIKWDDIGESVCLKGDTEVYTDFIF